MKCEIPCLQIPTVCSNNVVALGSFVSAFVSIHRVGFSFVYLFALSFEMFMRKELPAHFTVCTFHLLVHDFRKYEMHIKSEVSLNLKCVSHGRQAAQRLYQCYYSHWQIWRKGKKKKNRIRTVEISCLPSSLTYIQLDMKETIIAELSQSVHHFIQQ